MWWYALVFAAALAAIAVSAIWYIFTNLMPLTRGKDGSREDALSPAICAAVAGWFVWCLPRPYGYRYALTRNTPLIETTTVTGRRSVHRLRVDESAPMEYFAGRFASISFAWDLFKDGDGDMARKTISFENIKDGETVYFMIRAMQANQTKGCGERLSARQNAERRKWSEHLKDDARLLWQGQPDQRQFLAKPWAFLLIPIYVLMVVVPVFFSS